MTPMRFYGTPLPDADLRPYPGKLIAIEGTDGVGRSTHIAELRTWLEAQGYAVADTGMTRSELAGRGIKEAKAGHTLGKLTMQLFYATDFADRLDNEIIPALKAGFIVLTDRYMYSAIARAVARGMDPDWVRDVYKIALIPDAIFYLRIDSISDLVLRLLETGKGFDYWESGMDVGFGEDFYDSFVSYQAKLLAEFDRMTTEYNFKVIRASRSIARVSADLRRSISAIIGAGAAAEKAAENVRLIVGDQPTANGKSSEIVHTHPPHKQMKNVPAT
ncbi:MAG TPA: thymidylate kinase [Candidatus Kapabacteria bacterium]|nr:thymidylate kinase [Candidatus Kapabacteria bacterium]